MVFRTGGKWLITNMRRGESIFEIDPSAYEKVERGFELEGSNLSGVSARCQWSEQEMCNVNLIHDTEKIEDSKCKISETDQAQIRLTLQKGLNYKTDQNKFSSNYKLNSDESIRESNELLLPKQLNGVHLTFNLEAGSLLPLAIR